jgi:transcriptional regulator with XRE-family HTH domain
MELNVNEFVKRLEICCKEQGLTRTTWAKKIGFPESTIRNWLRNGNMPSAQIVYNFANYFGVPMEYLLKGEESKLDDIDFVMLVKFKKLSAEQKKMIIAATDSLLKVRN